MEVDGVEIESGETDAGDSERVAFAKARGDAGRFNRDAANAAAICEADEGSGLLDDAGEHGFILSGASGVSGVSGVWKVRQNFGATPFSHISPNNERR